MISTETAFEKILQSIKPILIEGGFWEVERKSHPEAFGSCYITFKDEKEFIRLVWDGKEGWFVIESMPIDSITPGWVDILLQFFKPNIDGSDVIEEIAEGMKMALSNYLDISN
jgi:hypothetical protein